MLCLCESESDKGLCSRCYCASKNYISGARLHFPLQPGRLGSLVSSPKDRVSGESLSKFKFVVSRLKIGFQEEVQSATAAASHEEEIVWSQLLLGSVHAMGQVGTVWL